jgi:lipopolysaccharide/colanic/teichoic acid biosynthesis glycosyltransferase
LIAKRLFDVVFSAVALLLLGPLLLLVSLWVKFDSPGPVFFRQVRVGLNGRHFSIHKFRTMHTDAARRGPEVTVGADPRITRAGAFLRRYKLDELPQFLDVLLGRMSIVGPRPEVPRYMDAYPDVVRHKVLSVRPGITDWASIEFRSESEILAAASDPERRYVEEVLPIKQGYYLRYVEERSFLGDLEIVVATVRAMFRS